MKHGTAEYNKYMASYMKKYRKQNPEKQKEWEKNSYHRLRDKVFDYLGGARCVNCGCTDKRFLEINHKNGGGNREQHEKYHKAILQSIPRELRKDEFDVRCRVCNAAYYLEQKFGIKYRIICPVT